MTIASDDVELYSSNDVSTSRMLGMADVFEADLPFGACLEVAVPSRNLTETIELPSSSEAAQLVVSLEGDRLTYELPARPRGYA